MAMKKADKDYYAGVTDCILALAGDDQADGIKQIMRCVAGKDIYIFAKVQKETSLLEVFERYGYSEEGEP